MHRASVGWMLRPYQANFRTKVLTAVMGFDHFRVRGAVPSTAQKLDTRFLGFTAVEVGTSSPSYGLRTGRSAGQHPGHLGLRSLPYFSLDVISALNVLNPSPGIGQHPLVATKCLSVVDHLCSPGGDASVMGSRVIQGNTYPATQVTWSGSLQSFGCQNDSTTTPIFVVKTWQTNIAMTAGERLSRWTKLPKWRNGRTFDVLWSHDWPYG